MNDERPKSRFRGVSWNSKHQKWEAKLNINKQCIWLGLRDSEEDAARLYRDALVKFGIIIGN